MPPKITCMLEQIDPKKAQTLLNLNADNQRNLKFGALARIVQSLRKGEWVMNGQPIIISRTGRLLDGQHRLSAVVTTSIPIETYVVRNIDDSVMNTIDTGVARNPNDVFLMNGIKSGSVIAAALNFKARYSKPLIDHGTKLANRDRLSSIPHQYFIDDYQGEPLWAEGLGALKKYYRVRDLLTRSQYLFYYVLFYKVNPKMATIFFDLLFNERYTVYSNEASVIIGLRRTLSGLVRLAKADKGVKLMVDNPRVCALMLKGFVKFCRGDRLPLTQKSLSYVAKEKFPTFKNDPFRSS